MAYPNSLLLIAVFLVATTSVANCQIILSSSVTGVAQASINSSIVTLPGVNVTLACNQTPVAPPVRTSFGLGFFSIVVVFPNASLINSTQCALFANATVGGVSAQLTAPIIPVVPITPGFPIPLPIPLPIPVIRVFIPGLFNFTVGA